MMVASFPLAWFIASLQVVLMLNGVSASGLPIDAALTLAKFENLLFSAAGDIFAGDEVAFQAALAHRRSSLASTPGLRWTYLCRCDGTNLPNLHRLSEGTVTPIGGEVGSGWYVALLTANELPMLHCAVTEPIPASLKVHPTLLRVAANEGGGSGLSLDVAFHRPITNAAMKASQEVAHRSLTETRASVEVACRMLLSATAGTTPSKRRLRNIAYELDIGVDGAPESPHRNRWLRDAAVAVIAEVLATSEFQGGRALGDVVSNKTLHDATTFAIVDSQRSRSLRRPSEEHYNALEISVVSSSLAPVFADSLAATLGEVAWVDAAPIYRTSGFVSHGNGQGQRRLNDGASGVIQSGVDTVKTLWEKGLSGAGEVVGCADSGLDAQSCYFDATGKIVSYTSYADANSAPHGTHVASSIAGESTNAALGSEGNGLAYSASISFFDIGVDNNEDSLETPWTLDWGMFPRAYDDGARLHCNSWGSFTGAYSWTGLSNSYTRHALEVDRYMREHEDFLVLYAAGNDGSSGASTVSSPAISKNCVAVGALSSSYISTAGFSSRGPTPDGRVKPDVVAPGSGLVSAAEGPCATVTMSGTSMATPVATAAAALARQYFREGWWPSGAQNPADAFVPTGALLKAVLIHGGQPLETGLSSTRGENGELDSSNPAVDDIPTDCFGRHCHGRHGRGKRRGLQSGAGAVSTIPPSMEHGWGKVILDRVLAFAGNSTHALYVRSGTTHGASLHEDDTQTFEFALDPSTLPATGAELKATLVWTDVEATVNSREALVNDLDLSVEICASDSTVLGTALGNADPTAASGASKDFRNNVEVAAVNLRAFTNAAKVRVVVSAPRVYSGGYSSEFLLRPQPFALVVTCPSSGCTTPDPTSSLTVPATTTNPLVVVLAIVLLSAVLVTWAFLWRQFTGLRGKIIGLVAFFFLLTSGVYACAYFFVSSTWYAYTALVLCALWILGGGLFYLHRHIYTKTDVLVSTLVSTLFWGLLFTGALVSLFWVLEAPFYDDAFRERYVPLAYIGVWFVIAFAHLIIYWKQTRMVEGGMVHDAEGWIHKKTHNLRRHLSRYASNAAINAKSMKRTLSQRWNPSSASPRNRRSPNKRGVSGSGHVRLDGGTHGTLSAVDPPSARSFETAVPTQHMSEDEEMALALELSSRPPPPPDDGQQDL